MIARLEPLLRDIEAQLHSESELALFRELSTLTRETVPHLGESEAADYLEMVENAFQDTRRFDVNIVLLRIIPELYRVLGDNVTKQTFNSVVNLKSWLSNQRLIQFLEVLPLTAQKLQSLSAFQRYLSLSEDLAALSPRCIQPFLSVSSTMLNKVNISGLRHWAMVGAKSHTHNEEALVAYFSLQSADSQAMFQQQRRGCLFIDIQRQLGFLLRAVWEQTFFLRPQIAELEDDSRATFIPPNIQQGVIHLPDALETIYFNGKSIAPKSLYRAMATHCGAHLIYGCARNAQRYNPLQQQCIGLFEDAYVEALAMEDHPLLRAIWQPFHQPGSHQNPLLELVHAIFLNQSTSLTEPFDKLAAIFKEIVNFNGTIQAKADMISALGIRLAELLEKESNAERWLKEAALPYRDDNHNLWREQDETYIFIEPEQISRTVNVMEMVNEIDCELADDDAQEIWHLETPFYRDGDPENVSLNELEGKQQKSEPFLYPEWDYTSRTLRPDWVTLTEYSPVKGDPDFIDQLLSERKQLVGKIKWLVEAMQPKGLLRMRKQREGDDLDLDAAIEAMKEIRRGALPDMNIDIRLKRQERDLAVLVLVDLSHSVTEPLPDSDVTILDIEKEATVMLASAIEGIGDPFAIHAFSSDGRSDVQYQKVKDFDESFDEKAKARLAGMKAGLSTRMGAALRHAKTFLSQQPARKKLLLMISDGMPSDIDVRDPVYLQADTKQAIDEISLQGITPFCLTIDPNADNYIEQIFGFGRFSVLDDAKRLPDILPTLFASITRHAT
ncbi:nitric oxide reductase activation protein NorD [Enterovibrio paralichthyis]|uniref:nitric oxide reductase activation protein NorD n=1 Tax=Enterovibrio paralichthyis TaxID=2853805 RepID=UPI002102F9D9|nr:VWA domain-containing protein [Enterovibrio paralichthyis]